MKRIVYLLIALLLFLTLMTGCTEEVSREAVDVRYTPAREVVETNYVHKYSWYHGDYVLVPEVRTVHKSESYSILYRITYDDGSTQNRWLSCTHNEYLEAQRELASSIEK